MERTQSRRVAVRGSPLKWRATRGQSYEADLGHGLALAVWWEGVERLPSGAARWNVSVLGRRLVSRSDEAAEGMRRAESVARSWLKEGLLSLSGIIN